MSIKVVGESVDDEGNAVILAEGVFEIPVSGNRLAELFWLMTDDQQAAFFNSLYELSEREGYNFNMQLAYIAAHLTSGSREIIRGLGELVAGA